MSRDETRFPEYPRRDPATAHRPMGDDGGLVVDPTAAAVQVLNSSGSRIYELLDGKHSQEEIIRTILDEYEASEQQVREDLQSFLEGLDAKGMLLRGTDGPKVSGNE